MVDAVKEAGARLAALAAYGKSTHQRTARSVALQNLASHSSHELLRIARNFDEGLDILAWSTRNIFEINLLIRYALVSEDNAGQFLAESAMDEQQVLEGFLSLSHASDQKSRRLVEDRVAALNRIAAKHGITLAKSMPINRLAKLVGCETEYTAMFKFMSKYVHPSSWLINKPVEETQSDIYRNILVIHAQLYAADSYERVREAFGVASNA